MKLGIYIQVPFCQSKCTYCNFKTGVVSGTLFEPYVGAVCSELVGHSTLYEAQGISIPGGEWAAVTVDTVYVGGGTPSLLEPAALARMLEALCAYFRASLEEATLEADPETITAEKAAAWRRAGINRISLGAQSFHDVELKAAGRRHRRDDIFEAFRILREHDFANISCDLIAGLPHQTADSWRASVAELLGLQPEHISIYLLEVDEGSRLGREVLAGGGRYSAGAVPDDDQMAEFYEFACDRLTAEGYEHYEISNWALPGLASRHNLKYWRREAYLGFGAGAHSFNGQDRWANTHDPAAYAGALAQGRLPVEQREKVTRAQALEEELFLGLRQLEGIDLGRIEREYNVRLMPRIERLLDAGLVERDGARVRLAPARLAVSNEVFVELLG